MKLKTMLFVGGIALLTAGIVAINFEQVKGVFSQTAGSGVVVSDTGEDTSLFEMVNINEEFCRTTYQHGIPAILNHKQTQDNLLSICRGHFNAAFDVERKTPLWTLSNVRKSDIVPFQIHQELKPGYDPTLSQQLQLDHELTKQMGYVPSYMITINEAHTNHRVESEENNRKNHMAYLQALSNTFALPLTQEAHQIRLEIDSEFLGYIKTSRDKTGYIMSGPIYLNNQFLGKVGENGAWIPTHFFKLYYNPYKLRYVAYIIPNSTSLLPKENYMVRITDIENYMGSHLFPNLDIKKANKLRGN